MKKKLTDNKIHMFSPSIAFVPSNDVHANQSKAAFNRSKTPFFRKKNNFNSFSSEEENISTNTLNKSINNQTFIYNSINFNNQGLFNNINNTNINHKRRKSGGSNLIVNNGILNFFETMKKSRSISKQKKSKYINIINKLSNTPLFCKTINKHKTKSFSKHKNNSFKNEKKKINNFININHINSSPSYLNNTNNFDRKNKRKLMTTNYNLNKNINMLSVLNNNNKINNLLMTNNTKSKKVKKNNDIYNKNINIKINNLKDSDRNENNIIQTSEESNNITEEEKNILVQIETLVYQLLKYSSSPKRTILKEIENIYRNAIEWCNNNERTNNYIGTESDIPARKKSNSNLNLSKKSSKKNLENEKKIKNNNTMKNKNEGKNKDIIEKELNILNKKYNQIKEENINLKYLITEKTTAFEDVKNSLKNFQNEINQLKNNNNNTVNSNYKNKNNNNIDNIINNNNIDNNVIINSKGVEIKNVKLNLSNVQRVNEIQDLSSTKKTQKESNTENNNNSFNCNNYSFGQNNSFEINFDNSTNSKKDMLNSNRSIDPLSLTFHDNIEELKQNDIEKELNLKNYDFSPSLRKATEILIQTGTMPNKNEKKIK